jgi:hypothetical protein
MMQLAVAVNPGQPITTALTSSDHINTSHPSKGGRERGGRQWPYWAHLIGNEEYYDGMLNTSISIRLTTDMSIRRPSGFI